MGRVAAGTGSMSAPAIMARVATITAAGAGDMAWGRIATAVSAVDAVSGIAADAGLVVGAAAAGTGFRPFLAAVAMAAGSAAAMVAASVVAGTAAEVATGGSQRVNKVPAWRVRQTLL